MDLNKSFSNRTIEEAGVWVDIGDGAAIKVARAGTLKYQNVFASKYKPYREEANKGLLPPEIADKILTEVIAEAVLLDWKGIEIDGVELPYSVENAIKILSEYRDFREKVSLQASESENFVKRQVEASAKNLKKPSAGKSSGQGTLTSSEE